MGRFFALRRREDFRRTMREGRRAAGDGLTVFVRRRSDAGNVRLGCIVRSRAAVARNRIRRRVKEALATAGPPAGVDVVVRADEVAKGLEFQEMVRILREALEGADGP